MRRLTALVLLALTAVCASAGTAGAEPRVGPPLDLYIFLIAGQDHATLSVNGRGCLPQDAPASVTVTIDRFPGEVFTAEPSASGRWAVDVDLPTPLDGVWVVNATCDNYFGSTVYPEARINADQVIIGVPGQGGGSSPVDVPPVPVDTSSGVEGGGTDAGGVANTGNPAGSELGVGLAALGLGTLLVFLGRPRRTVAHARSRAAGRHRH